MDGGEMVPVVEQRVGVDALNFRIARMDAD